MLPPFGAAGRCRRTATILSPPTGQGRDARTVAVEIGQALDDHAGVCATRSVRVPYAGERRP